MYTTTVQRPPDLTTLQVVCNADATVRQSFYCSAVLTPQHYHWYTLLLDSPSRRVASWSSKLYSRQRTESSSEHYGSDLSLLKTDALWCENKRGSDSNPWPIWIRKRVCYPLHHSVSHSPRQRMNERVCVYIYIYRSTRLFITRCTIWYRNRIVAITDAITAVRNLTVVCRRSFTDDDC